MPAPAVAVAARTALVAATDKRTRTGLAAVFTAALLPMLLCILLLMSFLSGGASHNNEAVEIVFHGGAPPSGVPAEYRQRITDMQTAFGKLDAAITQIQAGSFEGSLDSTRVKAVFYSLYFGADSLQGVDYGAFVGCFVKTETRTRTVQNKDGSETQETYTVTVPLTSLPQIYANLQKLLGRTITSDEKANATQIYSIVDYGKLASEETDGTGDWTGWSPSSYSGSGTTILAGELGQRAVQLALSRLGDPYSETLRGTGNYTDCSYLVQWTYRQLGVQLPDTAAEQGEYCVEHGLTVSRADLAPGDLVFWSYNPNGRYMDITHVAIYAGDGMVVSASSTQGKVITCKIFDADRQVLYGRPYGKQGT